LFVKKNVIYEKSNKKDGYQYLLKFKINIKVLNVRD
jgi:hypothetical protein